MAGQKLPGRPGAAAAVIAVALLLAGAMRGAALDWPVANRVVTGTFGEDRGDHFHNGIDIGGGDQAVHAVLPGELVFRYDDGSDYSSLPRGAGSFVVLRHDQHIRTVYAHLQAGSLGPERDRYDPADRIGVIGETGHANGLHLHFAVFDEEAGSAVNPLEFLPPIPDHQAPVVRRLYALVGEHRLPLDNGVALQPGKTDILAETYDLREDVAFRWPMGPAAAALSLDGREAAGRSFDSLQVRRGHMVLGGALLTLQQVWDPGGLLICGTLDLKHGDSLLRLAVRDLAGNEAVMAVAISVTP
jgi:hypothetical protein